MEPTTSKSVYVIKNLEKDIEYTSILTMEAFLFIAFIFFVAGAVWEYLIERLFFKKGTTK